MMRIGSTKNSTGHNLFFLLLGWNYKYIEYNEPNILIALKEDSWFSYSLIKIEEDMKKVGSLLQATFISSLITQFAAL